MKGWLCRFLGHSWKHEYQPTMLGSRRRGFYCVRCLAIRAAGEGDT